MFHNSDFVRVSQLVLRQFPGEVVCHHIGRDEYFSLLLSRRRLERCDDPTSQCRGLFDSHSGELFDIRESDLFSRA